MRIYICSSADNLAAIRRIRDALVLGGHEVLDWTPFLPQPGPLFNVEKDRDPDGRKYAFCSEACGSADLLIYLGPSGQDAGVELGIAKTSGVPIWGVMGRGERPGLMVMGSVDRWAPSAEAIVDKLTRWKGW